MAPPCHILVLCLPLGHSFGGMLACCVGAQLWHSTMADQEFLLQHIICITFAQPFLKIKMIEEQIKITPQFESAIHSIFSTDDIVPLMFSYLNVDESVSSLLSHPKVKTQVGPCDVVSKASTQSSPKPVCLAYCTYSRTSHNGPSQERPASI